VKRALSAAALGQAAEAALVALAIGGDEDAFSELVRRRQSWLRNLFRRLSRDAALADDLAQQSLLQAWRSLRTLKSVATFGGWLRQLAINVWLAHLRSARSRIDFLDISEAAGDAPADSAPAASATASEALDLDRALAHLSRDERLCVVLAYNEGMSHSEISTATGLPLGTVKSHIKRGAERLRVLLQAYQPAEATRHVR
jgi:RNA polymerase sigma factor (sigma-70 family)